MKNTIFLLLIFVFANCASQARKPQEFLSILTAELSEEVAGNPMGNNYLSYQFLIRKNSTDEILIEQIWLERGGKKGVWVRPESESADRKIPISIIGKATFKLRCEDTYSSKNRLKNTEKSPLETFDAQAIVQYKISKKSYFFPIQNVKVVSKKLNR